MTDKLERIEFTRAEINYSPNEDEPSPAEAVDGHVVGVVQEDRERIVVRPVNATEGQYLTFTIAVEDVLERVPYEPAPGELPDA